MMSVAPFSALCGSPNRPPFARYCWWYNCSGMQRDGIPTIGLQGHNSAVYEGRDKKDATWEKVVRLGLPHTLRRGRRRRGEGRGAEHQHGDGTTWNELLRSPPPASTLSPSQVPSLSAPSTSSALYPQKNAPTGALTPNDHGILPSIGDKHF